MPPRRREGSTERMSGRVWHLCDSAQTWLAMLAKVAWWLADARQRQDRLVHRDADVRVDEARQRNPECHEAVIAIFNTACRPSSGMNWQEQIMGMNKDQVRGRVKEAKGKIKEVAGKLVGNESMEAKGKVQKTLGKAQAKFGDVKQDLKDAKKPA